MSLYQRYPINTPPVYPTFSAFPASAPDGSLAVAADTDVIYVFSAGSTSWLPIGGTGVPLTVGALDGQPASPNGGSIAANSLFFQSASATDPGLVNNTTQTFSGAKTFSSTITGTTSGNLTLATPHNHGILLSGTGNATTAITPDASTTKVLVSGGLSADPSWQDIGSGALALGAFGSSPNSSGASLSAGTLTLQPADGTNPGGVSTTTQTFAGAKTFSSAPTFSTIASSSVLFAGTGGLVSADTGLIWDNTNKRLGIGQAGSTPSAALDVHVSNSNNAIQANNTGTQGASAGATIAALSDPGAAISSGSRLGQFTLGGTFDASHTLVNSLALQGFATETWSSSARGSKLVVSTTANTTTGLQTVLTLDQDKSASFTGALNVTGTVNLTSLTASQAVVTDASKNLASLAYASANTVSALVQRDGSGNFSAGTITAALTGTASGNTTITPANHAVVISSATNALSTAAPSATTGVPLVSNGAAADPSFGTVSVAGGGTGATSLTANNVILGNGTSAVQFVAPGTSGNILKSNGTTWTSAAITTTYTAPTIQTFTSGSGTYTTPTSPAPLYIRVKMVGGGGGGGGSASGGGTGGTGGTTTFGTTLLTCNGGVGGKFADIGGIGGTATRNSPAIGTAIQGGQGAVAIGVSNVANTANYGGSGAASPFGGQGGGGTSTGGDAIANTGSGGGGAGLASGTNSSGGSGGGAGGYIDAIIASPSASYSYAVGAGGTAGTAGSGGSAGGAGGSGYIEVTEYYQ